MANTKISNLSSASTPLTGSEIVPLNQSGVTDSVSVANLTAGRSVSASDYTASTGNFVPSTAGKGINFTANTPASGMTSQNLTWYEEGTWTPILTTTGTNFTSVVYNSITSGTYTRTGRVVTFSFTLFTTSVTIGSASGSVCISGLPFISKAYPAPNGGGIVSVTGSWAIDNPFSVDVQPGDTKMVLTKRTLANGASAAMTVSDVATGAGNLLRVTGTYQV